MLTQQIVNLVLQSQTATTKKELCNRLSVRVEYCRFDIVSELYNCVQFLFLHQGFRLLDQGYQVLCLDVNFFAHSK
jgi:hypothetical protein